ncbi:MAG: methyltransferase [Chitinivibrionales bacterium]|nr:methyltransferase [Chitinivibrionales bacterium]MBD3396677.1 methyltransferase [Chitinivibrionales bacterium]
MIALAASLDINGDIVELGAGWGTLAFPLAKGFPHIRVTAVEISPVPFLFLQLRALVQKRANLEIVRRDILSVSLARAGLVTCYLYPDAMKKLKPKFENELQPGTVVVSNTFAVPGWEPSRVGELEDLYRTRIYEYRFSPPS